MTNLKRRDFIRNTLIAGASTSLMPSDILNQGNNALPESPQGKPRTASPKKVIVAGAGISGLCCAYELMKNGHEVVVLEASGRHGGHVYTGRDGLSEGLYTDYGADHITKPGYERFFEYVKEFDLPVLEYPNAEGSEAAPGRKGLTMMNGEFYTDEMLSKPDVLRKFGFNDREVEFLSQNPWYALRSFYVNNYLDKFKDPFQPFGVGYDDLDNIPIADIYKKEGASDAALGYMGGKTTSALYALWRMSVERSRGIPLSQGDTYRLKGGNQQLPTAFAKKLGSRIWLNHPIQSIRHGETGVTVTYKAYGYDEELEMSADYLVNGITLPVFRNIPVTPALSPEKQYVVDNLTYSSHPFYVFEASTKFWLDDGFESINMSFENPNIFFIWEEPTGVDTDRVLLKAYGPGGLSPQRVLASFREVYPGKKDTIYQALTYDWTKDKHAPACEMRPFPIGEMHKFWPQIIQPDGRIYFTGTYADNLSRGMESCIRSAQRVAQEIHQI
uniref:FAD-dependent oxidoreductase n=1 Tax=Roseihalotalea indica TaxID=2867963 RepID=A0AA49GPB3_9BACT|nr:FAD-dependent oxidoreductase [Tunicatimonas sp. TK19036]